MERAELVEKKGVNQVSLSSFDPRLLETKELNKVPRAIDPKEEVSTCPNE